MARLAFKKIKISIVYEACLFYVAFFNVIDSFRGGVKRSENYSIPFHLTIDYHSSFVKHNMCKLLKQRIQIQCIS